MKTDMWCKLVEFSNGVERVPVPSVTTESGEEICPILRANLFDENGQRVWMVFSIPMDALPPATVVRMQQVLEAQKLTPVMLVPDQVQALRLVEVSPGEAKRMMDLPLREAKAREEAKKEPSRLILPR